MPNPGTFRRSRKEFLVSQKEAYALAVRDNYEKEALSLIQRKYFKRFPVDLPHDEEPSPEFLASVNDDNPDPECPPPYYDSLSDKERAKAMEEYQARQQLIQLRKSQIKRWLSYQYMKDHSIDSKDSGENNPFRALLNKLSGKGEPRPRRKTPANVWRRTHRDEIEKRVKVHASAIGLPKKHYAALRDRFARESFGNLTEEEQKKWADTAEVEHEKELEQWRVENDAAVSTAPKDRQRAIESLPNFAQPLLDIMGEATGWKFTLLAGGPEPAHDGKLNMISIHSGTIPGDIKMNFGTVERLRYKQYFVPIFGSFLQKCYSPEECRSRALKTDKEDFTPSAMELDLSQSVHSTHIDTPDKSCDLINERASLPPPYVPESNNNRPSALDVSQTSSNLISTQASCPNTPDVTPAPSPRISPAVLPSPVESCTPIPDVSTYEVTKPTHGGTKRMLDVVSTDSPGDPPPLKRARVEDLSPLSPSIHGSDMDSCRGAELAPQTPSVAASSGLAKDGLTGLDELQGAESFPPVVPPPLPAKLHTHSPTPSVSGSTTDESVSIASPPPIGSPPLSPVLSMSGTASKVLPSVNCMPLGTAAPSSALSVRLSSTKGLPAWLQTGLETLESRDLGPQWKELVAAWFSHAMKDVSAKNLALPAKGRPMEIAIWMKRHRVSNYEPDINSSKYSKTFMSWYRSIQPTWRININDGTINFSSLAGNWDCLRKSGPNGTLVIMVGLLYWGVGAQKQGEEKDWLVYVEDCHKVFTLFSQTSS